MTSKSREKIHLDLDRVRKIARHGGKRAAWFLALAINGMNSPKLPSHILDQSMVTDSSLSWPIQLVPAYPSPEQEEQWRQAYVAWTGGNCLRDLLEHYCLMLDEAHDVACIVAMKMQGVTDEEAERRRKIVRSATGVRPKLRFMSECYGISSDQGWWADDLYKARNILSHNFGVVQERHAVDGKLHLRWLGIEGWARGVQSNESLPLKKLLGTVTKEEMMIEMRQVKRTRSFSVGEQLNLSPLDFSEIFYSAAVVSARSFLDAVAEYIRGHGIPVTEVTSAEGS